MKSHNFKGIYLKLNVVNDRDILERLSQVPNRQGYIKECIRADIFLDKFYLEAGGKKNDT